jgi:hypothetical protein
MNIELKQTRVDLKNTLFHKPLRTSSIKFFGLLSEPGDDFPFHRYHDEGHDMLARIVLGSPLPA